MEISKREIHFASTCSTTYLLWTVVLAPGTTCHGNGAIPGFSNRPLGSLLGLRRDQWRFSLKGVASFVWSCCPRLRRSNFTVCRYAEEGGRPRILASHFEKFEQRAASLMVTAHFECANGTFTADGRISCKGQKRKSENQNRKFANRKPHHTGIAHHITQLPTG